MRISQVFLLACAAGTSLIMAQTPRGYYSSLPPTSISNQTLVTPVTPLPMWTYNVIGYDGGSYTGTIMGRSPAAKGKVPTTIPLQIIPLIITINNGGGDVVTYDPTAPDACVSGSPTVSSVVSNSPIFTNNTWVMNGVNVGNTQYIDAFQRAEFWSMVGGSNYHLLFSGSTLAGQALTFGSVAGSAGIGRNYPTSSFGQCSPEGVVQVNDLDKAMQALITTGPLASMVNVGTFPMFLTKNVVMTQSGTDIFTNCCILGYHSGIVEGSNLQVYSPFSVDTNQLFGPGYTGTISHEIAEAVNDPTTNNATPVWGNIGQDSGGFCQNNFEVGDPLSPGFGTPTLSFTVLGGNGLTYTMQELAYFSWFFGGTSTGTGGLYSNNGSFKGFAKACPPGGTN